MRIPSTLVLVSPQERKCDTDYVCCEYRVRITPNPSGHGAEIRVSPSLLPFLPPSFSPFSRIPDLCPSPSSVCRHGNNSPLPASFLSSLPYTFFYPLVLLFTFLIILVVSSPSGVFFSGTKKQHLIQTLPNLLVRLVHSFYHLKKIFDASLNQIKQRRTLRKLTLSITLSKEKQCTRKPLHYCS